MRRIRTPSRLHFGLLSLPGDGDPEGASLRRFGGVGLMTEDPGLAVAAEPAPHWSAEGPLAERALHFAQRLAQSFPEGFLPPHRILVEQVAPEHAGFGTGTQLGLAVARLVTASAGINLEATELARRVGRGLRSALGIHGFREGGFLVDGGQRRPGDIAPLVARVAFPESWPLVIALPVGTGLHGDQERRAFRQLAGVRVPTATTDRLCRLVLLGLLPALAEQDYANFGEALYELNVRVGEVFAPVQGGPFASPAVAEVVDFFRRHGVPGVGQSSWGPAVAAVAPDDDQARRLVRTLREQYPPGELTLWHTHANRGGAVACNLSLG